MTPNYEVPASQALGGFLLGFIVHLGVFIHGEWHVNAPAILVGHSWLALCLTLGRFCSVNPDIKFVFDLATNVFTTYLVGLFLSIAIYRLSFHPLARAGFPGPIPARLTKLWHVYAAKNSTNHLVLADLHRQYGDFVRTGPAELTIFDPEVFMAIDGPKSNCVKSEWYDLLYPHLALVTARDKSTHASRRRRWNQGFTSKALTLHEEKVIKYIDRLDLCIENDAQGGVESNIRDYLFWFGFDAMGDFVFNKSFGMLENRQWHHLIVRLQRALSLLGPFSPAPWLIQLGFRLAPRVSVLRDWFDMVAWCEKQMLERFRDAQGKEFAPDLTHYLMEKAGSHTVGDDDWFWTKGDSLLAIVAGSEPTAAALVGVFCELAKHPAYIDQIYEEVCQLEKDALKDLADLPCLNGVLNESLRLYPALLTGGARKTTEDCTIAGRFIPAHTTIIAPRYSISRRNDCFVHADDFIPERWYTKPDLILNKAAFVPFGTGHHSCLGRPLATDIMRLVVARLVGKYHIELAPGDQGLDVSKHLKDQFTANPGPLRLTFRLR